MYSTLKKYVKNSQIDQFQFNSSRPCEWGQHVQYDSLNIFSNDLSSSLALLNSVCSELHEYSKVIRFQVEHIMLWYLKLPSAWRGLFK